MLVLFGLSLERKCSSPVNKGLRQTRQRGYSLLFSLLLVLQGVTRSQLFPRPSLVPRPPAGLDSLTDHLEENDILSSPRHGFRRRKSCTSNLLEYLDKVTELLDLGEPVDVVFYDFSKAFDLVPHRRLIHKLGNTGITGNLQRWIMNWLKDRRQKVVLNGSSSDWRSVLSGVPQGSVLGPLLFLVFINDISNNIKSGLSLFADDTKTFSSVKNEALKRELQGSIDALYDWSKKWCMQFNAGKCAVLHLGFNNPGHSYKLGDTSLNSSKNEKDVGVIIQSNSKVDLQCRKAANTCNRILGLIRRSFSTKDSSLMLKLYQTYILPHLDYAIAVWNPSARKDKDILEAVQRRFSRMVSGMKGLSYEERLTLLELPTLEERRRRIDLIQAYRIWYEVDQIDHPMFKPTSSSHGISTRQCSKSNFLAKK